VLEATAAIRQLEALGHADPVLLACHPTARGNPFQALLYRSLWEHGIAPLPLLRLADLDAVSRAVSASAAGHGQGARMVLHLHWLAGVLKDVSSDSEARAAIDHCRRRLDRFRDRGGAIIWTVHNILPHDCRFPSWEARLRQVVVDRADIVHVMAAPTRDVAKEHFTIPIEKVFHVPHPNYIGVYPDYVPAAQARYEMGLLPDDVVYLMLGSLMPYKGLDTMLDAFAELRCRDASTRRRLVVAGAPTRDVEDFVHRCAIDPDALIVPRRLVDTEIQYYLRAADVVVLPYERMLNSGVLMLALSFGVPVIVNDTDASQDIVTPEFARTFSKSDIESLVAALAAADELRNPTARAAALAAARRHDSGQLAERFAAGLRRRLDQPVLDGARHYALKGADA
jgi:glycosyltransferase involved in cell wall biosynthesis